MRMYGKNWQAIRVCAPGLYVLAIVFVSMLLVLPKQAQAAQSGLHGLVSGKPVLEVPATVSDGEPFVLSLEGPGLESVKIQFRGKNLRVPVRDASAAVTGSRRAEILLSIPLEHKAAQERIRWESKSFDGIVHTGETSVRVVRKQYPVQRLTLESKYVTPDPSEKERIDRERVLMRAALNTFSPEARWSLPFKRPVPGIITSEYGLRRVLNGSPRSPHTGIDFRAAAGDPVAAIADGVVVLTGDFYYAGQFVALDHGLGTVSIYMHLSEIGVAQGQLISRGESIGRIGSTGRSTGPHLHLGLTVLGSSVSPMPLMENSRKNTGAAGAVPATVQKSAKAKKAAAKKQPPVQSR